MSGTAKVLLSTGSIFHLPLDEVFQASIESGFDGLELLLGPEIAGVPLDEFSRLSSRWGVFVACVHAPFFPTPSRGGDYYRGIEVSLELARRLGAAMVNAHPFGLVRDERQVRRLVGLADGLVLAIENMPSAPEAFDETEAQFINDARALNDFARENGLKVTYDVSHFASWESNIIEGYDLFRPNLVNIHLSDYVAGYQHLLPGRGTLPLARLLGNAAADGPVRFVTLEVSPEAFACAEFARVVPALTQAREFIQKSMSR